MTVQAFRVAYWPAVARHESRVDTVLSEAYAYFRQAGGEKAYAPHFPFLPDLGPDIKARTAVADKDYANRASRKVARSRGIITVIPH